MKPDPKLIALNEQLAKARVEAERWYARLKRAFNRLDRARQKVARVGKRIEAHARPKEPAAKE
jgi:hypothetical protein